MSSTNRSDARSFHCSDYYVTPKKPVTGFLRQFQKDENIVNLASPHYMILDPCAGWDEKREMTYPFCLSLEWATNIVTNDLREDSPAKYHEDFLATKQDAIYDMVITNPPFAIAQGIIEKSLEACRQWGFVIMLLRLNYIGSQARQEFWNKNKLYAIYAHNKRMSFTEDNKTDSIEYMHAVWKKWYNPEFAKFKILNC